MLKETTKTQRLLMMGVAILGGIFLMALAPTLAMKTVKISLDQAFTRLIPYDADFYPAVPVLTATYSIWIIIFVFAGSMALMLSKKLMQGTHWARATVLGLFAAPAVGGMTMVIPWFVLVLAEYPEKGVPAATISGMPAVAPVLFISLAIYYVILFSDTDSIKHKLQKLIPFTLMGVISGMVFMNGQHGVRYFIHIPGNFIKNAEGLIVGNPNPPLITDPLSSVITNLEHLHWQTFEPLAQPILYSPQTLALLLGGFMLYVSSALLIIAIPLMAMKKKAGWYIATSTALATAFVSVQGFVVRNSMEWLQGGMLSLLLFIVLMLPVFKKFFLAEGDEW
ncbi:MAG: hypothetical protein HQ525_06025 [Anaerolineae bacterium]|nr:hypothetical protein [Anaerolineae bacterium]